MQARERGSILLEVILAVAIMGIIMGVVPMTIQTLLTNPQRSSNLNIVLNQVQNAGHLMSQDVQMAKTVTPGETRGFPLTLVIPVDANPDNDYSVSYFFSSNNLKRQVSGSPETLVARYIDVENTVFSSVISSRYRLSIKASVGEAVAQRSYDMSQRISSG